MQYGIIKKEIQGRFNKYTELVAEQGYCFYDVNEEERNYLTRAFTPITDDAELEKIYVVVFGDADKLNEELAKEREEQQSNE